MPDMENSQLEASIRKEMGAESAEGTNSGTESVAEQAETADSQSEGTVETPETEKETPAETKEQPKEKVRGNEPKLLRERRELRRRVQELENKLKEQPETSTDDESSEAPDLDTRIKEVLRQEREQAETHNFFESNGDAKAKKKAIESLMDDHGLSVTDAWVLYQAKNDPKSLVKNSTKAFSSPSVPNFANRKDKGFDALSAQDQESKLKTMFKNGELSI